MPKRYPRPASNDLPICIVDYLLGGWGSHSTPAGVHLDDYKVFDCTDDDFSRLWLAHRAALMLEATRRGITQPLGTRFDEAQR